MLIHKPYCWEGACAKKAEGTWHDSWKALEEFYKAGLVRAIGICDVDDKLLDELLKKEIKPHIIQNWMDPFRQDKRMRERCKHEGIQYQAYSTLGAQWLHFKGWSESPVLTSPVLREISNRYSKTVAQIVINWATRHGVAILPASKQEQRQQSNLDSFGFELT